MNRVSRVVVQTHEIERRPHEDLVPGTKAEKRLLLARRQHALGILSVENGRREPQIEELVPSLRGLAIGVGSGRGDHRGDVEDASDPKRRLHGFERAKTLTVCQVDGVRSLKAGRAGPCGRAHGRRTNSPHA